MYFRYWFISVLVMKKRLIISIHDKLYGNKFGLLCRNTLILKLIILILNWSGKLSNVLAQIVYDAGKIKSCEEFFRMEH